MAPLEAEYDESINKSGDSVDDPKWLKCFPRCVADLDMSSNFMTRVLFVGFSMILHRRRILAQDYFTKNYITENLKCMSLSFKNKDALQIAQYLRQAGDAIKQGYLQEISLVITQHEGDLEAIEAYTFKFHYFKNGSVVAQLSTKNNNGQEPTQFEKLAGLDYKGTGSVRDQLVLLAHSINLLCVKILTPLPEEYAANFRVAYTDNAPDNYRIEGFYDSSTFYTLPAEIQSANLGHLRPGHHAALVDCYSVFIDDSYQAELSLKRNMEKVVDKLGFLANNTFYSTISDDVPKDSSQTLSEAESKGDNIKDNTGLDELSKSLAASALSPATSNPAKPQTRKNSGQAARASPYKSRRTRK